MINSEIEYTLGLKTLSRVDEYVFIYFCNRQCFSFICAATSRKSQLFQLKKKLESVVVASCKLSLLTLCLTKKLFLNQINHW